MAEADPEVVESAPELSTGEEGAAVSPLDFCTYFLQQLEGGTTIVPVTTKGDTAFTIFQFGTQRFKISVAVVKRVRKPKESNGGGGR